VMNTKYRKPITNIRDRHVLIELDGDFTHDEMRHILNHAYLNHKAPYEYDDAKKYIRDLVIGDHNSVYIMYNGIPEPFASASIFYPYLISNNRIYYDAMINIIGSGCARNQGITYVNNGTCTSSAGNGSNWPITNPSPPSLSTYGYNNGTTLVWELIYSSTDFTSINPSSPQIIVVGPYNPNYGPYYNIKYGYAAYPTSNNPLTLSTYYYWEAPTASFSYVYFNLYGSICVDSGTCYSCGNPAVIPIFYSQGNYSFNSGAYYITMWQWTYT